MLVAFISSKLIYSPVSITKIETVIIKPNNVAQTPIITCNEAKRFCRHINSVSKWKIIDITIGITAMPPHSPYKCFLLPSCILLSFYNCHYTIIEFNYCLVHFYLNRSPYHSWYGIFTYQFCHQKIWHCLCTVPRLTRKDLYLLLFSQQLF